MKNITKSQSPQGHTTLTIITHALSGTEQAVARLDEQLKHTMAFCRGLDLGEYKVRLFDFVKDRELYMEHPVIGSIARQKRSDECPLIIIDEELVWSKASPSNDELADLLKIGCRDRNDSSDCCRLDSCSIGIPKLCRKE